jgi:hypothetical protein
MCGGQWRTVVVRGREPEALQASRHIPQPTTPRGLPDATVIFEVTPAPGHSSLRAATMEDREK